LRLEMSKNPDCLALGRHVQNVAASNEAFVLLDEEGLDSFQTGGCALLAAAVEKAYGLSQVVIGSDLNDAEHVVNACEGGFIDSDGWQTKKQLFEKLAMEAYSPRRFRVRRGLVEHGFVCPEYLVGELARLLRAPRRNPHYEDYMPKGFLEFRKKYMKLRGISDLYVQFTTHQGDTLYRNAYEFPDHSDPAGIYAYPIHYVLKYPADIWYGAGAKYLRVLRVESPYNKRLDLQNIDEYDAKNILRRMGFYDPEQLLKKAKKLFKNRVGRSIQKAFFSAVQVDLDATDDANKVVLRSAKEQTDLFLRAGFETIEDTAKTNKKAVINDREPEQIIFLTRRAFSVVEIFRLSGKGEQIRSTANIDESKRKLAALIAKGLDDKVVSTDTYDKFWTAKGRRIEVDFERPQSYYEGKKMGEKKHRESKLHTEHITKIKVYTERGLIKLQGQSRFKDFAASVADSFDYREQSDQLDQEWEPETRELYEKKLEEQQKKAREAYQKAEDSKKINEVIEWDMPLLKQLSKEQKMPFDADYWLASDDRLLMLSRFLTHLKRQLSVEWYSVNQTVDTVRLGEIEISLDMAYRRWSRRAIVDEDHFGELCDLIMAGLEKAQAEKNSQAFYAFHLSRLVKQ